MRLRPCWSLFTTTWHRATISPPPCKYYTSSEFTEIFFTFPSFPFFFRIYYFYLALYIFLLLLFFSTSHFVTGFTGILFYYYSLEKKKVQSYVEPLPFQYSCLNIITEPSEPASTTNILVSLSIPIITICSTL